MAETATKLPIKTETKETKSFAPQTWRPFETLRREIDRLFDDFDGSWTAPFKHSLFSTEPAWQRAFVKAGAPAVDITEKDNTFEVTAELPGMDEKNIEVKLVNGSLLIKGEKQEDKEEKRKDYYLRERQFGSFERRFTLPETVDANKIDASFKKGVLTVTLPKKAEAVKPEKKIEVKAA
jgi:HSP20 family protein